MDRLIPKPRTGRQNSCPQPRLTSPLDRRLLIALGIELVALFNLPAMATWQGIEREIWQLFAMGLAGGIPWVLILPVVVRGSPVQRLWAVLLAVLPAYMLWGVGVDILHLYGKL